MCARDSGAGMTGSGREWINAINESSLSIVSFV
jgi:hypothetical protein